MRRAFTLIELLIVVAIIGILAAIAVPNFLNAQIRAKIAKSQSGLRTYRTIQSTYLLDQGDIPGHCHGCAEHCPYINMGYINEPLADPFVVLADAVYPLHKGLLHSSDMPEGDIDDWRSVQPLLIEQWFRANEPYCLFGQGPTPIPDEADPQAYNPYESSNGLRSVGIFIRLGVRGKGKLRTNLEGRQCD